jgi:hypothetical protein
VAGPYKVSEGQLLNGAHPSIGGNCVWGASYIGAHETGAGAITCQIKRNRGRAPAYLTPPGDTASKTVNGLSSKTSGRRIPKVQN